MKYDDSYCEEWGVSVLRAKISFSDYAALGSLLFGMFFGAGNLIFPVFMGQMSGSEVLTASLGFIVTAVGLPFLGIVAMGLSRSDGLFELVGRVHPVYSYIFTILLYLTIGPFFALPRTGTVSYEIGLSIFVPEEFAAVALAAFTLCFFGAALFFALRPNKILVWIGKVLNPLFLVFLGILLVTSFAAPMGTYMEAAVRSGYTTAPFFKGFTEGYNTMDALAALAFGIIVVKNIKALGVTEPREVALGTMKAGIVSVVLMSVIYLAMAVMGAASTGVMEPAKNGAVALALIANYYFGSYGNLLLAIIVTLACLKTAIGLIVACAETFAQMFPHSFGYRTYTVIFAAFSCVVANIGLTQLIALSIPVLMFLYPLAITLIMLALLSPFFNNRRCVYLSASAFVLFISVADGLNVTPAFIRDTAAASSLIDFYETYVPLGMGWIIPMLAGLILGVVIAAIYPEGKAVKKD